MSVHADDDEPTISETDLRSLYLSYGDASARFDSNQKREGRELFKLVECAKAVMWHKARAVIEQSGGRPLLYSYSSDGTPCITKKTYSHTLDTGENVVRCAGAGSDFLMQSAWLKSTNKEGAFVQAHIFKEAVPLEEGATALHELTACVRFFPMVRTHGHEGVVVSHYAFDRALFNKLTRLNKARHRLYYEVASGSSELSEKWELQWLKDWTVATPCPTHDLQNSLKWGMSSAGMPDSAHRDLFAVIESLRSSFKIIHSRLGGFITRVLRGSVSVPSYDELFNIMSPLE